MRATHAREIVGYSENRLWQVVNALLEREDALRERPAEVRRLLRLREMRKGQRRGRS